MKDENSKLLKKYERHVRLAKRIAKSIDPDYQAFRYAAIALNKRGHVVGVGINDMRKTHPKMTKDYDWPYVHAEFAALNRIDGIEKGTIIVIRLNRRNEMRNSYPCESCFKIILEKGIRNVIYVNQKAELAVDQIDSFRQAV